MSDFPIQNYTPLYLDNKPIPRSGNKANEIEITKMVFFILILINQFIFLAWVSSENYNNFVATFYEEEIPSDGQP